MLHSDRDFSVRLTDIDNATREVWKEDKLDDAEEMLSRQIIRRTGSDHTTFANRALIRTRLHRWDAALRDAEIVSAVFLFLDALKVILSHVQSLDIQPSVAACVAKGFALFGQQKYASAVHAFNVALRECDVRDRALVSLVKVIKLSTMYAGSFIVLLLSQAIVLFEVGYHAESMAEIADLIEHCPVEARSTCSAAQASVSKRLA